MLAARSGSHRDFKEKATIKIDDPASPLTAAFHGQEFEWQDEFFRFTTPPYSRDKIHVLLSFDVAKTDMHQKPDCEICDRADNDIAVSWIRSYGKGRIFYATIGHLPTFFETPTMAQFFLAGNSVCAGRPGCGHNAWQVKIVGDGLPTRRRLPTCPTSRLLGRSAVGLYLDVMIERGGIVSVAV